MNILKKSLAPVTDKGWNEITERIKDILDTHLTARKFVDIDGPNGLEFGGVSTGRLIIPENQPDGGVNYGIREMLPLVEVRKPFELDMWELDNVERGAKDIDLSALDKAAKEFALFEETAIYEGFEPAKIKGLNGSSCQPKASLSLQPEEFLKAIGSQVNNLSRESVSGPYTLVINAAQWINLLNLSEGYPVLKQLREIVGGKVLISHNNSSSYLVSERGGDYELVIGQDISCGYEGFENNKVKLYLSSSFTFRVLSPEAVVVFD
ncbi:MAG: bacteriocin family protein [Bacteroides graminisolvens]|nr:bacteriocin family protein [Bacteroides graminisolvens]